MIEDAHRPDAEMDGGLPLPLDADGLPWWPGHDEDEHRPCSWQAARELDRVFGQVFPR